MNEQGLMKQAALAIRQLQSELSQSEQTQQEQTAQLEHTKRAQKLTSKFLKIGHITLENFDKTFTDFCEQSSEQLDVVEKAAAMTKNGNGSFLGKVANYTTSISQSPEERFIQRALLDD